MESACTSTELGSAKTKPVRAPNGGLWVANTPKDTEAVGLTWQQKNWDVGILQQARWADVQRERQ